jgi:hypothetical protein
MERSESGRLSGRVVTRTDHSIRILSRDRPIRNIVDLQKLSHGWRPEVGARGEFSTSPLPGPSRFWNGIYY